MTDVHAYLPDRPVIFTQEELSWLSWLEHLAVAPGLSTAYAWTQAGLSRDATTDMPLSEQALCAAVTARFNGCFFCASVHARLASHLTGRPEDLQLLLDRGVDVDLGPRWNVLVAAAVALSATPSLFGPEHVRCLRGVGFDDAGIAELVDRVASCNEANRLTLSLGEPRAFFRKADSLFDQEEAPQ